MNDEELKAGKLVNGQRYQNLENWGDGWGGEMKEDNATKALDRFQHSPPSVFHFFTFSVKPILIH